MPSRVTTRVRQELFVFHGADSITKPARWLHIRLSLEHGGNCLLFQYSAAGGFIAGTCDCRGDETGEIRHSTNLAANGLRSQLPVTDFLLFVIVGCRCATFEPGCPDPLQ